jgi:hypothetical protein
MARFMVRDESGQALVEMALLVPVLLLLVVGIFDFGRVFYSSLHLEVAAQETVRKGGLGSSDSEMESFAKNYLHVGDPALLQVHITPADSVRKSGDYVSVELTYPVELVTPMLSNLFNSNFNIHANSTIRVE